MERIIVYTPLHFSFNWDAAPTAAPAFMQMSIFPEDNSASIPYTLVGQYGGDVTLQEGSYRMLCYNGDTESLQGVGDSWEDYEILTKGTRLESFAPMFNQTRNIPLARGTENQPVIMEPEMLWTGSHGLFIHQEGKEESITVPIQPSVYTYTFVITGVRNLSYVTNITGTISGMAQSMFPATGLPSKTACIIPFEVENDGLSQLTATVKTFGHCPDHDDEGEHSLVIYAMLRDGSKYYYTFDVTTAMHDMNHSVGDNTTGHTEVPIVLDDIPFPKPITNGSGMHPTIDEWVEVKIDVSM